MAILKVLEFPDPRLRNKAQPVTNFDSDLQTLINDMFETMYAAPGIGLAATQVDVHQRLLVVDVSSEKNEPLALINPEIVSSTGNLITEEGCLSVPGFYAEVERAEQVLVRYADVRGESRQEEFDGLKAVCVQHEMDHLDGRLFVDYLSEAKRQRVRKRLLKERRLQPESAAAI